MSRVGPILCPVLVGRDDLLELADRRMAEAVERHGELLLLAGEAGVGKSRLLWAIQRRASAAGFRDANGSVSPQDRDLPCGLILEMARTMRKKDAFGSLGDDLIGMRIATDTDQLAAHRLFVLDIVDRIIEAVDRPTILTFEDLQWADDVSLEIVGELARRSRELPLLLVASYRIDELPPGTLLREWRARLLSQRHAEEARLAPLTYDQTALMTTLILDSGLPAPREVVDAIHARTDGIPLHIEELLGALSEEARSSGRAIRDADVPESIEDAIIARIAMLTPDAREVARAGAVIGRCFIPEVLAGVMDRPLADLDGPLAELADRAYLHVVDVGYVDFRHQLLRDVLYRTVPPTELRRLHARAAEFGAALEGQKETHASVHYERAGMRIEAHRAALSAARDASRISSRREAFELYRRAIANMPPDLPSTDRASLYAAFASAAAAVEEIDEVDRAASSARDAYLEAGMPIEAALQLTAILSTARRRAEPADRPLQLVAQGLAELDALSPSLERDQARGIFISSRAFLALTAMQLDLAGASAREAREVAEATGDAEGVLDNDMTLAEIDIVAGRVESGLARTMRAARESRDAGFEETGVGGFRNLAALALRVMEPGVAAIALSEGLRYADAIEQSHCRQMMAATTAQIAWAGGHWDDAVELGRQELVERGCRRGVLGAKTILGFVAMGRGELESADRWLTDVLETGRAINELDTIFQPLWGLAEVAMQAGDARLAFARSEEALDVAINTGERAFLIPFVVTGTRAAIGMHRPDEAERWVDRTREHLVGWESVARPAFDHATGLLKLVTSSISAARDGLEAAVRGWDQRGRGWEAAWARLDLAQALLRANRYGEAATQLTTVRSFAEANGSSPLLDRAAELARVGRGRGTLGEPWYPLTAREFEVARLVAEGLTNAEIAERLSIAPKTASAHIEHILAKLGVTRRAEIAAWSASVGTGTSITTGAGSGASGAVGAARRR